MTLLQDYNEFQGLHWETGSLRNYLAYKGVRAPHTNQPYSEAMLLGISGGIVMGYYTFDYQGYDPMVRILTRNTFNPLETIYDSLDINPQVKQSSNSEKGEQNLVAELDSGSPGIVFADMYSLPYNMLDYDEGMWAMMPILVYGYDLDHNQVWIADRSKRELLVTTEELATARGRTKKNRYRIVTHEAPNPDRLEEAVRDGIRNCVNFFTEPPPKGSKHNFGFLGFQKWIDHLQKPNLRGSWQKEFATGSRMYAVLVSAFEDICIFGKDGWADRKLYAQFLDESSVVLSNDSLIAVSQKFARSAEAWDDLADSLLSDDYQLFKETKDLIRNKHHLFLNQGTSASKEMRRIKNRLSELRSQSDGDFPLNDSQADDLRLEIADKVNKIMEIEQEAINSLAQIINK